MIDRTRPPPRHHPDAGMLLDYATGVIQRPFCAWVATHLTFCPACRQGVARLECLGGAVIERAAPVALTATCLEKVLARLDQVEQPCTEPDCCQGRIDRDAACLPVPLRRFFGVEGGILIWQPRADGVGQMINATACTRGVFARLVRLAPGVELDREIPDGHAVIIVLDGGFVTADSRYGVGDVAMLDHVLAQGARTEVPTGCLYCVASDTPMAPPPS